MSKPAGVIARASARKGAGRGAAKTIVFTVGGGPSARAAGQLGGVGLLAGGRGRPAVAQAYRIARLQRHAAAPMNDGAVVGAELFGSKRIELARADDRQVFELVGALVHEELVDGVEVHLRAQALPGRGRAVEAE